MRAKFSGVASCELRLFASDHRVCGSACTWYYGTVVSCTRRAGSTFSAAGELDLVCDIFRGSKATINNVYGKRKSGEKLVGFSAG